VFSKQTKKAKKTSIYKLKIKIGHCIREQSESNTYRERKREKIK